MAWGLLCEEPRSGRMQSPVDLPVVPVVHLLRPEGQMGGGRDLT
jgi:hypothetical protein